MTQTKDIPEESVIDQIPTAAEVKRELDRNGKQKQLLRRLLAVAEDADKVRGNK